MRAAYRDGLHAALGAAAGLAGVTLARCSGGACSSCLACAIPGASVVLLALASAGRGAWRSAPVGGSTRGAGGEPVEEG